MASSNANLIVEKGLQYQPQKSIEITDFNCWIGRSRILENVNVSFIKNEINCIIGPSGSGKTTLIRCLNRINDETNQFKASGQINFNKENINDSSVNVNELRSKIGMVFQKPCVFPTSISENVVFGLQGKAKITQDEKDQIVEETLKAVGLWKEVSHRLHDKATSLSLGQQQRLCIARALATKPEVLLLDEPTSSLDPLSTKAIEELMLSLKEKYTIIFVTHNILQARKIADQLVFVCGGEVVEYGTCSTLFNNPKNKQTKAYLTDEFCDC